MVQTYIGFPNSKESVMNVDSLALPTAPKSIDASNLEEVADLYLEAALTGASKESVAQYRFQLRPFLLFWNDRREQYDNQLSPQVLDEALEWVRHEHVTQYGEQLSATSVFNCFARLRQLFNWAYRNHCTGNVNLIDWMPKTLLPQPDLYFPEVSDIQAIIDAVPECDVARVRDLALMCFMISTGVRVFEVSNLLVGNLHFETPVENLVLGEDHSGWAMLKVVKGNHHGTGAGRPVAFCSKAGLVLKCYYRSAKRGRKDPVFPCTSQHITRIVRCHALTMGLPGLTPHAFRRAFCDYFDEHKGIEYRQLLKRQMGHTMHTNDVTQRHYIDNRNVKRLVRDLREHHISPLDEIEIDWLSLPVTV